MPLWIASSVLINFFSIKQKSLLQSNSYFFSSPVSSLLFYPLGVTNYLWRVPLFSGESLCFTSLFLFHRPHAPKMRGLAPVQSLSQTWALSQKFCICSLLALPIAFCYSPCSRKNKQLSLPQSLPSSQGRRGSPPGDPVWPRGVPSSAVALSSQLSSLVTTLPISGSFW